MAMKWQQLNSTRFKISRARGNSGDEHTGDILISYSAWFHMYTTGAVTRTLTFDNGHTETYDCLAGTNKFDTPDVPLNEHFMHTRVMTEDNSEYFCLEQKVHNYEYEYKPKTLLKGEVISTKRLDEVFLASGSISVGTKNIFAPAMIEYNNRKLTALEECQVLEIREI